jgi:hypothetical protein
MRSPTPYELAKVELSIPKHVRFLEKLAHIQKRQQGNGPLTTLRYPERSFRVGLSLVRF